VLYVIDVTLLFVQHQVREVCMSNEWRWVLTAEVLAGLNDLWVVFFLRALKVAMPAATNP